MGNNATSILNSNHNTSDFYKMILEMENNEEYNIEKIENNYSSDKSFVEDLDDYLKNLRDYEESDDAYDGLSKAMERILEYNYDDDEYEFMNFGPMEEMENYVWNTLGYTEYNQAFDAMNISKQKLIDGMGLKDKPNLTKEEQFNTLLRKLKDFHYRDHSFNRIPTFPGFQKYKKTQYYSGKTITEIVDNKLMDKFG